MKKYKIGGKVYTFDILKTYELGGKYEGEVLI